MIQFENVKIGLGYKPFVVAEMSGNHNQSLERALAIVDAAADAGAHAIKLQTYTADTMTLKGAYVIQDPTSLWYGRELHELYQEAHTPWEWHRPLFEHGKKRGITVFSSPFDETSVDFLSDLQVSLFKIASFENTDVPLLRKVAATKKPVILSTGASSLADIERAVVTLRAGGCEQIVLLKCTSTYPATPENTNLATIPHMAAAFNCPVGLSDHTMGIGVAVAAVALGVCVIEKHFTLSRADGGVDSAFSMEPAEMKALVIETERAWQGMGRVQYGVQQAEQKSLFFKRSLYIAKTIQEGEVFTTENIRVLRPGDGLAPHYLDSIIGRHANKNLEAGKPLTWDDLIA